MFYQECVDHDVPVIAEEGLSPHFSLTDQKSGVLANVFELQSAAEIANLLRTNEQLLDQILEG
jgi:hypothetical protein